MTLSNPASSDACALGVLQLATPAGPITVLLTADEVVRAAGFCAPAALLARLPSGFVVSGRLSARGGLADAVAAYGDGDLAALDAVAVEQSGGPFMRQAWQAMRAIAPGTTTTYAALAAAAGSPAAVRAAGGACARNLVALFVPCHRVLRSDGSTGGYLYGDHVKEALLAHELS